MNTLESPAPVPSVEMIPLYVKIARTLQWMKNIDGIDDLERHETLKTLAENKLAECQDELPSGSGIDSGTKIDLDASSPGKIVLTFGFHHMDEGGGYDGWTEHTCIIRPSLAWGMEMRITGRDRNQIKDYLAETYHYALTREVAAR